MQCGPVRYRVDAKSQAATRSFSHKVTIRETRFRLTPDLESKSPLQITALYAALAQDEKRNDRIFDDVLLSLEAGRRPLILTNAAIISTTSAPGCRNSRAISSCSMVA
jgi:hypothetical protein